jgi:hypothetical protein
MQCNETSVDTKFILLVVGGAITPHPSTESAIEDSPAMQYIGLAKLLVIEPSALCCMRSVGLN